MRKLIAVLTLSLASVAHAGGHGQFGWRHHEGHHRDNYGWVAPLIVGGVVTYALTRPAQPVIVQQQPQPVYQAPVGYHYENILDANCNCYRLVLVQN